MKDFCGECICRYCRWIGTDNCLKDESPPCDHCRKGDKEFFACEGYTTSPNGRQPK